VIARLLDNGPAVIRDRRRRLSCARKPATSIATRRFSIWLKADVDVIMKRIKRRADRPLLQTEDPAATLAVCSKRASRSNQSAGPDDLVARRAARPDRRRMYRCLARPAGWAALRQFSKQRRDERHAMTLLPK